MGLPGFCIVLGLGRGPQFSQLWNSPKKETIMKSKVSQNDVPAKVVVYLSPQNGELQPPDGVAVALKYGPAVKFVQIGVVARTAKSGKLFFNGTAKALLPGNTVPTEAATTPNTRPDWL